VYRNRPVSLALVGLFIWVTACTSYTQIGIGEVADHGNVRVTLTNGEHETLHDPWVEGDSIKARTSETVGNLGALARVDHTVAFPFAQVVALEAVGTDEVGTIFTVLGIAAGVFVIVGSLLVYGCTGGREDTCSFWGG